MLVFQVLRVSWSYRDNIQALGIIHPIAFSSSFQTPIQRSIQNPASSPFFSFSEGRYRKLSTGRWFKISSSLNQCLCKPYGTLRQLNLIDNLFHLLGLDNPQPAPRTQTILSVRIQLALIKDITENPPIICWCENFGDRTSVNASNDGSWRILDTAGDEGFAADLHDCVDFHCSSESCGEVAAGDGTAVDVSCNSHGDVASERGKLEGDGGKARIGGFSCFVNQKKRGRSGSSTVCTALLLLNISGKCLVLGSEQLWYLRYTLEMRMSDSRRVCLRLLIRRN